MNVDVNGHAYTMPSSTISLQSMSDGLTVLNLQQSGMDDVRAFVEVVRAGGFAAASRTLGVSKSTLSRQVQRLEADLGVRLMNRTTRRVALTNSGEDFFRRCHRAVDAIDAATLIAKEAGRAPRGTLKVSCPYDLAQWMASITVGFRTRFPDIRLVIRLSQRHEDLVAGGLDVAIRGGPRPADSTIRMRVLASGYRMLFCAHPEYLAAHGTPRHPGELLDHTTVGFSETPLPIRGPSGEMLVELAPTVVANEFGFLRSLLLQRYGVGFVLETTVVEDLRAGRLVRVLPEYFMDAGEIRAMFASRRILPKLRAFLDYVAQHPPGATTLGEAPRTPSSP